MYKNRVCYMCLYVLGVRKMYRGLAKCYSSNNLVDVVLHYHTAISVLYK